MADTLGVDTDGLAAPAQTMTELADDVQNALTSLQERMNEAGDCWGDDAAGREFLTRYAGPAEATLGGVSALGQAFTGVAARIRSMAATLNDTENNAIAQTNRLPDPAPGR